jgi:hypothetical protein
MIQLGWVQPIGQAAYLRGDFLGVCSQALDAQMERALSLWYCLAQLLELYTKNRQLLVHTVMKLPGHPPSLFVLDADQSPTDVPQRLL